MNNVGVERGGEFLKLSPNEKWLISRDDSEGDGLIWNLANNSAQRVEGSRLDFSGDSRSVATLSEQSDFKHTVLEVRQLEGASWWKRSLPDAENSVSFSHDGRTVQTETEHTSRVFDASDGRLLRTNPLDTNKETTQWKRDERVAKAGFLYDVVSFIPVGASKPKFSFSTSNEYDTWEISPNKRQLWISLNHLNRFDVLDARTGKRLWFYGSTDADSGQFFCYPKWEEGGMTLVTIENDALIVRDSRTGKVLLNHKNNLPAPLKSWAFTKDRSAVYLMDAEGEIFWQRLR